MKTIFYVYLLRHPITQEPLYVGKGKNNRAFYHSAYYANSYIAKKVRKIKRETLQDVIIEFLVKDLTEEQAFNLEKFHIAQYGRKDNKTGILYNLTDGGEGPANRKLSSIHIERLNKANKGKKLSDQTKQKLSDSLKGRKVTWGDKISESLKGTSFTDERKKNISESRKKFYQDHPEARISYNKGIPHSDEAKKKMSESLKLALSKPEVIEKRSKANTGGNNPRAKRCKFDTTEFSCISEAIKFTGLHKAKLKKHLLFSFI